MPAPRKPRRKSKEAIKEAADRAEGKESTHKPDVDPLNPAETSEPIEEEELFPGGVTMRVRKSAAGRPKTYKPEFAKIAEAMLRLGATIGELAELFGVSNVAIWRWRQTYVEFGNAFCNLNEKMDERIERALADRAAGYTYDAVKIFQYEGNPVVVPHKVHVPPDISAIKLYLSARKPEQWRNKEDSELSPGGEAFVQLIRQMSQKK